MKLYNSTLTTVFGVLLVSVAGAYDTQNIKLDSTKTSDGVEVIDMLNGVEETPVPKNGDAIIVVDPKTGKIISVEPIPGATNASAPVSVPPAPVPVPKTAPEVDVVELNFVGMGEQKPVEVQSVETDTSEPDPEPIAELVEEVELVELTETPAPAQGLVEVIDTSSLSEETVGYAPLPRSVNVSDSDPLNISEDEVIIVDASTSLSPRAAELDKLSALAPQKISMFEKPLHEVVTYLAQISGANYIAPPVDGPMSRPITLKVTSNPWRLLERLARDYHIGMEFEDGIWQFYTVNIGEMVMRRYELHYNNLDAYEITAPEMTTSISGNGNGGGGEGGENGTIEVKTEELIKGVQSIMGLPLTGIEGAIEERYALTVPKAATALNAVPATPKGLVYYAKDTNELLVVASRQQHDYIDEFLAVVDRPQRMVWMEIMLVEMTYDPFTNFGLDFSGASGNGITISGLSYQPFAAGGASSFLNGFTLSTDDWTVVSNFLSTDSEAKVLQHPRITTLNKESVSFQVVTQEPIVSSSGIVSTGATATNEIEVTYLDIGLIMTIAPVIYSDGPEGSDSPNVQLNIGLVLSNVIGTKTIREIDYPVVAKRQWEQRAIVPSGITLAMGGVVEERNEEKLTKVPFLGDIPLLGGLFSDREVAGSERHLMAFITPVILEPKDITDSGNVEALPRQKEFMDLELTKVKEEDPLYPLVDFSRANQN